MLKRLHLKNFTVFADADFEFSPGLNVLVGTNGTGKSHVLKMGYAVARTSYRARQTFPLQTSQALRFVLGESLRTLFLPSAIGNLVRYQSSDENAHITVKPTEEENAKMAFQFSREASSQTYINVEDGEGFTQQPIEPIGEEPLNGQPLVNFTDNVPRTFVKRAPIFIPAKETLTMFPGLRGLYREYEIGLDETYPDLCEQLDAPLLKANTEFLSQVQPLLTKLEKAMAGRIVNESGHFYFYPFGQKIKLGINLLAEGMRKLATIAYLLSNGRLRQGATLFWDEPEANLNPALLRKLAAILAELARQGFQIILATHSMSLLKEFHILSREPDKEKLPIKYFGLNAEPGQPTTVVARDDFKYLPDVVALEVELDQADDLEEIFARESR